MKSKTILCLIFLSTLSVMTLSAQWLGNVNGDQVVDIVDALLVAQYYVGITPKTFYATYADSNASGKVDIIDALLIARYYVGMIKNFPIYDYPIDPSLAVLRLTIIDENS